jgi:hypothetical protein
VDARWLLSAIVLTAGLAIGCGEAEPTTRGNGATALAAGAALDRGPYMGVSCRLPNEFGCDRVGLAVWLRRPAASVDASIAGRNLRLDDEEWSEPEENGERRMFAGFLQPAGLIDGPLGLVADYGPGRWIGRDPVSAPVELRIVRSDGSVETTGVEVELFAGWG